MTKKWKLLLYQQEIKVGNKQEYNKKLDSV